AGLPEEEAEYIIQQNASEYPSFGLSPDKVRQLAQEARKIGYAYSRGIVVPEIRTIAVSLLPAAHPHTVMSLSIVTLESRLLEPRRTELVRLLRKEAAAFQAPGP